MNSDAILRDFDSISELPELRWTSNKHYHQFIVRNIRPEHQRILDIGCGKGDFTRLIAKNKTSTVGVDLSAGMIQKARQLGPNFNNIEFLCCDYLNYEIAANSIDCIMSIATIHHMNATDFASKAIKELTPGGRLIILDLYETDGLIDQVAFMAPIPFKALYSLYYNRRLRSTSLEREYWNRHAETDSYLSMKEVRSWAESCFPGATVRRHFFWRYSLIWDKPQ